jgi:glycosyltransferase involved in cell wall biosynthesis
MTRVSVAIAAYKSEYNIANLLDAITVQSVRGFELAEILVHCDGQEDATADVVRKYMPTTSAPIRLIETKPRRGYARAMQTIFTEASGDILITLNDDIQIQDGEALSKVVNAFGANPQIGMVTGRPAYLPPRTFFGKALATVQRAYHHSQYDPEDLHTAKTVDGKLMAFSRKFYSGFRFPENTELVGNVDCFLYFSAITTGFLYYHAYDVVVYGRNPESISDYIQFTVRCNISNKILSKSFDEGLVSSGYKSSRTKVVKGVARELLRAPHYLLLVFAVNKVIKWRTRRSLPHFSPLWESVKTTKELQ